jgi:hypothetical protein
VKAPGNRREYSYQTSEAYHLIDPKHKKFGELYVLTNCSRKVRAS